MENTTNFVTDACFKEVTDLVAANTTALQSDLRDLRRLCIKLYSWVGADTEELLPLREDYSELGVLQRQFHESVSMFLRLLLRALEGLPPFFEVESLSRCMHLAPRVSVAQLGALLWARIRVLRKACLHDLAKEVKHEAVCSKRNTSVISIHPRATQTEISCFERCESCVVAEAAFKDIIQVYMQTIPDSMTSQQTSKVTGSLIWMSQWGAMSSLTNAVRNDLQTLVESRENLQRKAHQVEVEMNRLKDLFEESEKAIKLRQEAEEEARADLNRALQQVRECKEAEINDAREKAATEVTLRKLQERISMTEKNSWAESQRLYQELNTTKAKESDLLAQLRINEADLQKAKQIIGGLGNRMHTMQLEHSEMEQQLQIAMERYSLLLQYPDLHGPLEPPQPGVEDPILDMENQVRANDIRINLLTSQNERLRTTISKLRALTAVGRPPTRSQSRPNSASNHSTTSACPLPYSPNNSSQSEEVFRC